MDEKRVEFVDFQGFLDGALEMGMGFDDGVREIFDNSIDADAENILLQFIKLEDGGIRVIIEDDGKGIPLTFVDDDGVEKYGIPFIMAFGNGTADVLADGRKHRIGKFGYGLSQTITCLAHIDGYAEVWTKRPEDAEWRTCSYSYKQLVAEEFMLPPETTHPMPPMFPQVDHGTIVVIDIPDPEVDRVGAVMNRFLGFIGRTYRKHLAAGLRVMVMSDPGPGGKKVNKRVRIKDPLCITPRSEEVDKFGPAVIYDPITITFDGNNGFPACTNPLTGEFSQVRITLTRMRAPVVADCLHEELQGLDVRGRQRRLNRWGVGDRGQGFSLVREGRELASAQTFGIYTKSGYFNYMHGEFEIDSGLDQVFKVRTNKSKFSISPKLRNLLRDEVESTLLQIGKDHEKDDRLESEIEALESGETEAERLGREAAAHLPRPPLDEAALAVANQLREEARVVEEERAKQKIEPSIEEARQNLKQAQEDSDFAAADAAEASIRRLQDRLDRWVERIGRRFASRAPARIHRAALDDGSAYSMQDRGDEARIIVNTEAQFYPKVYGLLERDPQLRTVVDLMLMSLGYAEFIHCKEEPHEKDTWIEARREVSAHLHAFVRAMSAGGEE